MFEYRFPTDVSSLRAKLSARRLDPDFKSWNYSRRAKLLLPIFIVIGGAVGLLVQSLTAADDLPLPVIWTAFTLVGYIRLAIID